MAAQHHRLHSVEQWPAGPSKQVAIYAVQSGLDSLSQHPFAAGAMFACAVCESQAAKVTVMEPCERQARLHVVDSDI
jgi:hypothetical protein